MSVVVIQQPNYLPWLGYFEQMASADHFIFLDNVQWIKQGRQHRTSIAAHKSQDQVLQWLSLPVHSHGHRDSTFQELQIAPEKWAEQHWRTIQAVYGSAPFFQKQIAWLQNWLMDMANEKAAAKVAAESAKVILSYLDLPQPKISFSSEMKNLSEDPSKRILELCQHAGASIYYSAMGGTSYLSIPDFRAADIRIVQQNFRIAKYREFSQPTLPLFSIIDALAYCNKAEVRSWLLPKPWGLFAHRLGAENSLTYSP